MAQAGKDEMIEADGVFRTAERLQQTAFSLNWYPKSGHVITVGPERRQLEQDVADFLAALGWRENNGEKTIKQNIGWIESSQQKKSFNGELAEILNMRKSEEYKLLVQTVAQLEREKAVEFNKKVGLNCLFNPSK